MARRSPAIPIRFNFNERKAVDAAAFLIHMHGGEMNYMLLLKFLYAAERESLKRFNRPIIGDRYVSMRLGPVVSRMYDLIKDQRTFPAWDVLIERSSATEVRLLTDEPELRSLSDADIEALTAAVRQYPDMDQFDVSEAMHRDFPEWEDPGDTSLPIPVERMLAAIHKSPEDVERIRRVDDEKQYFQRLFGA